MATRYERFLRLSAELTAHSTFDLQGTGLATTYAEALAELVGVDTVVAMLDAFDADTAGVADPDKRAKGLRSGLLADPRLGPLARNVIKLWYVGLWYALPEGWTDVNGFARVSQTHMVTGTGYVEALLWPAIGASPPGAKAPGYRSWVTPPRIPTF